MVIDCHYHLEERALPVRALMEEMGQCGVRKVALMGSMIEPFREPPKFLISLLQIMLQNPVLRPVGKSLVSNFSDRGELKILGTPYPIETDPDNQKVFDAVERYPDVFLGWVFVNPKGKRDPIAEYVKYRDRPGFVGVKAHPFWHRYPPVELVPVAEKLAATGKPLLIHPGFGRDGDFEALLERVPHLKLILAHAGFPEYARTWERVAHRKNVFFDLSQTSYTSEKATRGAFDCIGPDRLFFGTDGPYGFHGKDHRYDYGFLKRRIERMFPDPSTRERLLGGNFMDLVGLS